MRTDDAAVPLIIALVAIAAFAGGNRFALWLVAVVGGGFVLALLISEITVRTTRLRREPTGEWVGSALRSGGVGVFVAPGVLDRRDDPLSVRAILRSGGLSAFTTGEPRVHGQVEAQ